jgi:hypothetical protein
MSITVNSQLATAIINVIAERVPSLAYDYSREQAAPLATPPATRVRTHHRRRPMCPLERAIRARDIAATVAALH